jgi:hypothetical protein
MGSGHLPTPTAHLQSTPYKYGEIKLKKKKKKKKNPAGKVTF